MIVYFCPGCSRRLVAGDERAGQPVRCPVCAAVTRMPHEQAEGPPANGEAPHPNGGPRQADAEPEASPELPGYQILGELARGKRSVIYQARMLGVNRLVALKVRATDLPGENERGAADTSEAHLQGAVKHPHVVEVHAVPGPDGRSVLQMEYMEGGSLAHHLAGTPQPPALAARLLEPIARAVHAAHQQGIVHGDLNPRNILLTSGRGAGAEGPPPTAPRLDDALPKLSGFGLARRLGGKAPARPGDVPAPAGYLAPEQAEGRPHAAGVPADVYGLGAVLYELLTGRPPFAGVTPDDTLRQVRTEDPVPPARLVPGVPRDMETVCLRCLHKDPRRRYGSAAELADDLARWQRGEPVRARRPGPAEVLVKRVRRRPRTAAVVAALLGVLAFSVLQVLGQVRKAERALAAAEDELGRLEDVRRHYSQAAETAGRGQAVAEDLRRQAQREAARLATERGRSLCAAGDVNVGLVWLAHGLELALEAEYRSQRVLRINLAAWVPRACSLRACREHPSAVAAVAFAPDGASFAAADGAEVRGWPAEDGPPRWQYRDAGGDVTCLAFSPDGRLLLAGGASGVSVLDAATGQPRGEPLAHPRSVSALAVAPDGRTCWTACGDGRVRRWGLEQRRETGPGLEQPGAVHVLALSPDGARLLTAGPAGEPAAPRLWDTATGRPTAALPPSLRVRSAAFAPDGRTLLTGDEDDQLRCWDVLTGKPVGPPRGDRTAGSPVLALAASPDGRLWLAGGRDGELRLWDAGTGQPAVRPLAHPGPVQAVACAADGKAFLTASGRTVRLWGVPSAPPVAERPLESVTGPARQASFSRDRQRLAVTNGSALSVFRLDRLEPVGPAVKHAAGRTLALNADGTLFAVSGDDHRVRVYEVEGGQRFELAGHTPPAALAFSPDGQHLLSGGADGTARLWDLSSGEPVGSPWRHPDGVTALAFSPDGQIALTGTRGGEVRRWDVAAGEVLGAPARDEGAIDQLAFRDDTSAYVVGCRGGRTLRFYDPSTDQPVGPPLRLDTPFQSLALSTGAQLLAVATSAGPLHLLDAANGQTLGPPLPTAGRCLAVSFSPEGRSLLWVDDRPVLRRWVLPYSRVDVPQYLSWARFVSGFGLDEAGNVAMLTAAAWAEARQRLGGLRVPPIFVPPWPGPGGTPPGRP